MRLVEWAAAVGLVASVPDERRLQAMGFERLAQVVVPCADTGAALLTAQWAAFICLVDDMVDRSEESDPAGVRELGDGLLRVLDGDTSRLPAVGPAAALADLWSRTVPLASASWRARFRGDYADFWAATEREARLRAAGVLLDFDGYVALRRRTITVLPMAAVVECAAGALLPQDAVAAAGALRGAAADVLGFTNDLASAEEDLRQGHDNLVAVLARTHALGRPVAFQRAVELREARLEDLRVLAREFASGPPPAARYADALTMFVSGCITWLGDTGRFDPRWSPAPSGR